MPELAAPKHKKDLTINFLRDDRTGTVIKMVELVTKVGLPVAVVISISIFGLSIWKFMLDQELMMINDQVSVAAMTIESNVGLERELNAATSKYNLILESDDNNQISFLLPKLVMIIPNGVRLIEMSIDQERVSFVGYALSRDAITALVNNINLIKNENFEDGRRAEFSELRISEISSSSSSQSDFNFSLSFDYKIIKE